MLPRSVDYGGRTCFYAYLTWTVLSGLAIVLIPPYLDATHSGGTAMGMTSFNTLLPTAFYGYCSIAFFYLLKFGVKATFRSIANAGVILLLVYIQYYFWAAD